MLASVCSFAPADSVRPQARPATLDLSIRMIRPSLLDQRFSGDPWIVDQGEGPFAICLGNYPLAWIEGLPFDLPSLNRLFCSLRQRRARQIKTAQIRLRRGKAS